MRSGQDRRSLLLLLPLPLLHMQLLHMQTIHAIRQLLGSTAAHRLHELDGALLRTGDRVAEITVQAALLLAAQVTAPGVHAHHLTSFGQAKSLGNALVRLHFRHCGLRSSSISFSSRL